MTTSTPSAETEQTIRAVVDRAVETQNDPGGFLPLHTSDVVIVNLAGHRVFGKAALAEAMRGALQSPLADVLTTVEVLDIRMLHHDVALVNCMKRVHDNRAEGSGSLPSVANLTYVMTNDGGNWLIAAAQTTPQVQR